MDYKAPFFILKKIKYLESDLIIHALSKAGEKISFLAKGALRSKKRFGGGILEPTHQVLLTYQRPIGNGQLYSLKEAQIIQDFSGIRRNYETLDFALQVIDCIERVSQEGDVQSEILYNLLGHTLKALESTENLDILKVHFYLKFMMQQGVITLEPWMALPLKTQLQNHADLLEKKDVICRQLESLELKVRDYVLTAMSF